MPWRRARRFRGGAGARGLPGAAWLARRRRRAGERARAGAAVRGTGTGTGTGAHRGTWERLPRALRGLRGGRGTGILRPVVSGRSPAALPLCSVLPVAVRSLVNLVAGLSHPAVAVRAGSAFPFTLLKVPVAH